jgi:hypothetical protein
MKEKVHNIGRMWIPESQMKAIKDHYQKFWANVLFGNPTPREPEEDDNVKLAWVTIAGKRTMAGVDNKTMKGYKLRQDVPMWELPLIPLEYDHFERWCTGFDV